MIGRSLNSAFNAKKIPPSVLHKLLKYYFFAVVKGFLTK